MSTRSNIGIENEDGSVETIYCHSDGYPSGVGRKLFQHYSDEAKVRALLALGNLSELGAEIGEKCSFDDRYGPNRDRSNRKDQCLAYGRDRGESDAQSCIYGSKAKLVKDAEEYSYLLTKEGWIARHRRDREWVPLRKFLEVYEVTLPEASDMTFDPKTMTFVNIPKDLQKEMYEWTCNVVLVGKLAHPAPAWVDRYFKEAGFDERQGMLFLTTAIPQRIFLSLLRAGFQPDAKE